MEQVPSLSNEEQLWIFAQVKNGVSIDDALKQAHERSYGRVAPKTAQAKISAPVRGPAPAARTRQPDPLLKNKSSNELLGVLSVVKNKINAKLQAAPGACSVCGLVEHGGVSRACRVCDSIFCGSCKIKHMIKSADKNMPKKRRWICTADPCLKKDPDLASRRAPVAGKQFHGAAAASTTKTKTKIKGSGAQSSKQSGATASCPACSVTVYALEQVKDAKGATYHRSCFQCHGCKRPLQDLAYDYIGRNMYCNPPGRGNTSCLYKAKYPDAPDAVTKGAVAGSVEVADYDHVDVLGIIETIGAKLEAALDGMIPRCEVCGSTFTSNQTVVIMGQVKKHKECFKAGKAMFTRDMTPRQAVRFLDELLTLRFFCNGKWLTYFFVADTSAPVVTNESHVELKYLPDPKSHAPNRRKCAPAAEGKTNDVDIMEVTSEYKPCQAVEVEENEFTVTGFLSHQKFGLLHHLMATFTFDGHHVAGVSCVITISTLDEEGDSEEGDSEEGDSEEDDCAPAFPDQRVVLVSVAAPKTISAASQESEPIVNQKSKRRHFKAVNQPAAEEGPVPLLGEIKVAGAEEAESQALQHSKRKRKAFKSSEAGSTSQAYNVDESSEQAECTDKPTDRLQAGLLSDEPKDLEASVARDQSPQATKRPTGRRRKQFKT